MDKTNITDGFDIKKILSHTDHTLLSPTATFEDIKEVLEDGIKYEVASACIPPCYVKRAKEYVGESLKICTVIGFPLGYSSTETKLEECKNALLDGADEIDTVINLGALKAKDYSAIEEELRALKELCGNRVLKVIVETCLLTEEEKIKMCKIVSSSGADYIKTSTGFSTGGAVAEDIELFAREVAPRVKIKAAGGISSFADAEKFLSLGADRLGTSRLIKIVKKEAGEGY